MSKPWTHSLSSAKRFGGKPEDYLAIHEDIDHLKRYVPDNRGRALTHNSWYIYEILPRLFGTVITNSDGKEISVSLIGEYHVLEDYGMRFIPSPQDWLCEIELKDWMNNGQGVPPSCAKLFKNENSKKIKVID